MERRRFLKALSLIGAAKVFPALGHESSSISLAGQFVAAGGKIDASALNNPSGPTRIGIVAIGGGGCAILSRLPANLPLLTQTIAIDTKPRALNVVRANHKILVSPRIALPHDPKDINSVAVSAANQIRNAVAGLDVVLVIVGMGGVAGTVISQFVGDVTKETNILTIVGATIPFAFESGMRQKIASFGLKSLHGRVDAVVPLSNQLFAHSAGDEALLASVTNQTSTNLEQLYRSVAGAVDGRGLISMDLDDLWHVFKSDGYSAIGYGSASGGNGAEVATLKAINAPLLGSERLRSATEVLVSIEGAQNSLKFREINTVMKLANSYCQDGVTCFFSAVTNPVLTEAFRVTILASGVELG